MSKLDEIAARVAATTQFFAGQHDVMPTHFEDRERLLAALRAVEAEIAWWRERCTTIDTGDVALRAGAYKIEIAIQKALA